MRLASSLGLQLLGASGEVYFSDTFEDLSKWVSSTWKEASQMGTFVVQSGKWTNDEKDTALATTVDARFYAAAAEYPTFTNDGKTLVVQYQLKYDKDIECGGGYIKLGPKPDDLTKFGDPTAYNIMFGPDKCGYSKRTHLIFSRGGKNVLKTSDLPYKQDDLGVSYLYRLTLTPDNKVKVDVNKEEIYSGELGSDWKLLPPETIYDPSDVKPDDWVDEPKMDDPEDKKPEDWVEEKSVVDADAKQPEDWDVEEDGEWEPPMKANPLYKGQWFPKRIDNPAYKGPWMQKTMPNPEYAPVDNLYKYDAFGFVGFDLWQVKAGALIDNVLVTDDVAEADKWAEKWQVLHDAEVAFKEADDKEKAAEAAKKTEASAKEEDPDATKDVEVDKDDDEEDL